MFVEVNYTSGRSWGTQKIADQYSMAVGPGWAKNPFGGQVVQIKIRFDEDLPLGKNLEAFAHLDGAQIQLPAAHARLLALAVLKCVDEGDPTKETFITDELRSALCAILGLYVLSQIIIDWNRVEELHHIERHVFLGRRVPRRAFVLNLDDILMIKRSQNADLAIEAFKLVGVGGSVQELDRTAFSDRNPGGPPHFTVLARPERLLQYELVRDSLVSAKIRLAVSHLLASPQNGL